MKKVIKGLLYDTETAKKVGQWTNGIHNFNDFNYCWETLYRKKTGEYFIHGEGGGNSKYGVWVGNSGGGGEQIRPYTPSEAREWAEKHLDVDEYIAEFGEPEESPSGKVVLNLSVLPATKAKLEKLRQDTGKSISQLVDEMVLTETKRKYTMKELHGKPDFDTEPEAMEFLAECEADPRTAGKYSEVYSKQVGYVVRYYVV